MASVCLATYNCSECNNYEEFDTTNYPVCAIACGDCDSKNMVERPARRRGVVSYVTTPKGLLDDSNRYHCVAQQTNCLTCSGVGLAYDIANAFPYGCSYATRMEARDTRNVAVDEGRSKPGTIEKLFNSIYATSE